MTQEELRHTLKNKLKECDKDTLVDIILLNKILWKIKLT